MKKKTILIPIAILALGLSAGCCSAAAEAISSETVMTESMAAEEPGTPKTAEEVEAEVKGCKTLGDAFALQGKDEYSEQRATYQDQYIYVFTIDGVPYRFTADLPADVSKKYFELEFDENYDKNEMELVSGLEIKTVEYLNDQILTQEELDALVGKTGKELFDAGWRSGSFYNTETLEISLEYGPFSYLMHFDGEVPPEEAEDFDVSEDLADMRVLDVEFEGLGDATYID